MASIKARSVLLQIPCLFFGHKTLYVTSLREPSIRRASGLVSDTQGQLSATNSNNKLSVIPQSRDQSPNGTTTNSASADDIFQQELQGMNKATLNCLKISNYPRSQRRLIDQERCKRRAEGNTAAANKQVPTPPPTCTASSRTSGTSIAVLGPSCSNDDTSSKHAEESPKIWYMFPEHHKLVVQLALGVRFNDLDVDGAHEWQTNICGTFRCSKETCGNKWGSGVVATVIRGYLFPEKDLAYNAKVFNQRCKECDSLGYMTISRRTYLGRVIRRLKIWRNEKVDQLRHENYWTGPHKSELCEGCKAGKCGREGG
ncbi:hypothetical protein TWF225_010133 [Orbilia oligospora]|uniref:Uncharacterized protein n=1 Tax=Orbilia oligospora TaxID=2813651 RepID=A0A7C8TRZ4_ORBOL|nr:hypothetical protein TWF751_001471 [Orbilia oligospora]KAF3193375.1 hypothetical protein TWF225_010133 [Orbilia oligospora]KAF3241359.1 hypothetical protein TWF128_011072 [Orbilia oligospora]KAF3244315.1 hypothetical protein TWF217_010816 [Orbilia oligospora]KAF3296319.1 hypothetical protein TWF132_010917 [Orbilia oligospora]